MKKTNQQHFKQLQQELVAASGDLLILYMLRRHKKGKIIDHPSEIGYVVFLKN